MKYKYGEKNKMKLIKHKKYSFEWIDCMVEETWTAETNLDSILDHKISQTFENVGYFIKEYKGFYIFTSGLNTVNDKVEHYFSLTLIPKAQITKIYKLI